MKKSKRNRSQRKPSTATKPMSRNNLPEEMFNILSNLKDRSTVAVVTLLGSLCPITKAHVQAFAEARQLFLNEQSAERPPGLETFHEMIGFISVNPDSYVSLKFSRKGEVLPLKYNERVELVQLAIADVGPWMGTEEYEGETVRTLQQCFPNLSFIQFTMNGADDVMRSRKWRWANEMNRYLTMGRKGDTERVAEAAARKGVNPAYFIMGTELPEISSTAVREALLEKDSNVLDEMLHPGVKDWCLEHGRWGTKQSD